MCLFDGAGEVQGHVGSVSAGDECGSSCPVAEFLVRVMCFQQTHREACFYKCAREEFGAALGAQFDTVCFSEAQKLVSTFDIVRGCSGIFDRFEEEEGVMIAEEFICLFDERCSRLAVACFERSKVRLAK